LIVASAVVVSGCGSSSDAPPEKTGPRLAAQQERRLPLDQSGLRELCPEKADHPAAEGRRLKAQRTRQLDALIAALESTPDAIVRATFTPADRPGIESELITVAELAESHLDALETLGCAPEAQDRIRRALES
jgi:hypothetical protein